MIRIIIENIILFLLPTAIYVAYVYLRRRGEPNISASEVLEDAPLLWLFAIGAIMAIGALAYFGSFDSGDPSQTYTPPGTRDGTYAPGRYQ